MAKPFDITIDSFYGGKSDDIRQNSAVHFSHSNHFDTICFPHRLVPVRTTEADENKTFKVTNFLFANTDIYGLGVVSGTTRIEIFRKNTINTAWAAATSAQASAGYAKVNIGFVHFEDYLFGWHTDVTPDYHIWKYGDITATPSFTDSFFNAGSGSNTAPSIIGKDGNLYMFLDNKMFQITAPGSAPSAATITLPEDLTITCSALWGNKLLIGCEPDNVTDTSKIFVWDYVSTTIDDVIDWGQGDLKVLENMDGRIWGIGYSGNQETQSRDITMNIKSWTGTTFLPLKEVSLLNDYRLTQFSAVQDSKIFFAVDSFGTGSDLIGIWVFGRKNINYPYSITQYSRIGQDESITSLEGYGLIGTYHYIAHSNDGSVDRTDNGDTYNATSVYESQKFGDAFTPSKLHAVALAYDPLPTAGQAVLKYRINEDTSWTTIFTDTTDNSMGQQVNLPIHFNEIQFRIESTGGAEITKLRFKGETLGNLF